MLANVKVNEIGLQKNTLGLLKQGSRYIGTCRMVFLLMNEMNLLQSFQFFHSLFVISQKSKICVPMQILSSFIFTLFLLQWA